MLETRKVNYEKINNGLYVLHWLPGEEPIFPKIQKSNAKRKFEELTDYERFLYPIFNRIKKLGSKR